MVTHRKRQGWCVRVRVLAPALLPIYEPVVNGDYVR